MAERSEAVEEKAVRDLSAVYSVEPEIATAEDVPPGYKWTEVGVIPEGWDVVSIGELARTYSGGTPSTARPEYYGGDIPWITSSDLNRRAIRNVEGRITKKGIGKSSAKMVEAGTLIVALYGATAGVSAITNIRAAINQAVLAIVTRSYETKLLLNILSFNKDEYVEKLTQGGQPNLSGTLVRSIKVPAPPIEEQRAIATALSDADALIESLDRLIAKKRAIKQAAMQQLLTGQTRLPGFTGEWETKRLGELLTVRYGRNQSEIEKYDGRYPILATGGEIGRTDTPLYERPSVLIGRKGTINEPRFMDSPFWTVDTLFYTEIHEAANPRFMFYIFTKIPWRDYNEASGVPSLNGKTIEAIQVFVPDIKEQTAIATVLSDMDTEIEALERRCNKARQIKQGMMQQLLTGRVRLVEENRGNASYG
ncbi:restriction endonuclease subunit S [Chromohalobacter israelensis]|uniref:restriction endonuclease subunit S n=1 Tax=Chromohalobacter israelensis TaxID=141390 RepID=UPI000556AC54|nr:restriction endonuclease subunit S [Chromohalobacter israelensis]MDF9434777.1 restriction endonuclease subunit S [Chromohalobacter israelensis]